MDGEMPNLYSVDQLLHSFNSVIEENTIHCFRKDNYPLANVFFKETVCYYMTTSQLK